MKSYSIKKAACILLWSILVTACSRAPLQEHNPHQIIFQCKKSTEVQIPDVGPVAITRFKTQNVFIGGPYDLKQEDHYGYTSTLLTFYATLDGVLIEQNGKTTLDRFRTIEVDAIAGRKSIYWLISRDGQTAVRTAYVPYPIEEGFQSTPDKLIAPKSKVPIKLVFKLLKPEMENGF